MEKFYFHAGWAKKPRLQRAIEAIHSVRNERGKLARGDFLLRVAVDSLSSRDADAAKDYIEKFLLVAPNVSSEHRAIVNIVLTKLLAHQKFKLIGPILNVLYPLLEIFKLMSRNLLSCNSLGVNIPVEINVQYSSNTKSSVFVQHFRSFYSRTVKNHRNSTKTLSRN